MSPTSRLIIPPQKTGQPLIRFKDEVDKKKFLGLPVGRQIKAIRRSQNSPRSGLLELIEAAPTLQVVDALEAQLINMSHMSRKTTKRAVDALRKRRAELGVSRHELILP